MCQLAQLEAQDDPDPCFQSAKRGKYSGSMELQGLRVTYQHLDVPLRQGPASLIKQQGGNLPKKRVFLWSLSYAHVAVGLIEMAASIQADGRYRWRVVRVRKWVQGGWLQMEEWL